MYLFFLRARGCSAFYTSVLMLMVSCGFLFAACGGGSTTTSVSPNQDANAPVTVWVDADRMTAVKLYEKAHPQAKINAVVVDRNQFPAKVLLENNIQSGWPDVVFAEPDLVAQVSDTAHNFPLDLTSSISSSILANFAGESACTFNGKIYCLRNDLAQNVLWYNVPLMQQFGYSVPTTWEEYEALGLRVAREHPGYIIGEFGDAFSLDTYFWGSHCPVHQDKGNAKLLINLPDANCTRMANLIDTLLPTGVLSRSGFFDAGMTKHGNENKILMLPGASWMGDGLFKGTFYKTANHQLGAAAPLKWQADAQAYTGAIGGAAWMVSRHSKNINLAVDFVKWVTTAPDYLGHAANYPAYKPVADVWKATLASDPIYASNPYLVLQQAALELDPQWSYVRFDDRTVFGTTVVTPVLTGGGTVASKLAAYQQALEQLAQSQGYEVVKS